MYRVCSVLLVAAIAAATANLPFENCGSEYRLISVTIDACSTTPCDLNVGTSVKMEAKFFAEYSSTNLRREAYYVVNSIHIPVNVISEPCPGTLCNVEANETKTYNATIEVNEELPPLLGELYWRLFNENNRQLVCYKVEVRLLWTTQHRSSHQDGGDDSIGIAGS